MEIAREMAETNSHWKTGKKQGRIHDCSCRGRLGRGSNDLGRGNNYLGRGSDDLGRGMLKYKLSNPLNAKKKPTDQLTDGRTD